MSESPSATSLGNGNGPRSPLEAKHTLVRAVDAGSGLDALARTPATSFLPHGIQIAIDHPFGVTGIVGGTNVRFCISLPGQREPVVFKVSWEELDQSLKATLHAKGINFQNAKREVFAELAVRFVDFVENKFHSAGRQIPFDQVCAFNLSVAGLVEGHGLAATVSTSNTGIVLREETIAKSMLTAINSELQSRRLPTIPPASTAVMNDATAGMLGELYRGGLKGCTNGLFLIIGTGVGSMGLVDGKPSARYSELGHNVIVTRDGAGKRYEVLDADKPSPHIDNEGQWHDLPIGQQYVEHELAGPWLAIRFIQQLCKDDTLMPLLAHLAERIRDFMPSDYSGDMMRDLMELGDLTNRDRRVWAINSSSKLVTAVNRFLLNPDLQEFFSAFPCDRNFAGLIERDPKKGLIVKGGEQMKRYFKEVGLAIGAIYRKMEHDGCAPEKIVIGGGIGEAYNPRPDANGRIDYEHAMKLKFLSSLALVLIHEHGGIPEGTVAFSTMSPEEREAVVTSCEVERVMEVALARIAPPSSEQLDGIPYRDINDAQTPNRVIDATSATGMAPLPM